MTDISIESEMREDFNKKVEFHVPEEKQKSVIGFESMTSPAVLNLLKSETSRDRPCIPASRSASSERLLKDESIMHLQGREVLFATGIFFLVSLSVAFIFIIATTTLEKFNSPTKNKITSPPTKCKVSSVLTMPDETIECEQSNLGVSEADLKGKFGRELRNKLCEITLNSICLHEMTKYRQEKLNYGMRPHVNESNLSVQEVELVKFQNDSTFFNDSDEIDQTTNNITQQMHSTNSITQQIHSTNNITQQIHSTNNITQQNIEEDSSWQLFSNVSTNASESIGVRISKKFIPKISHKSRSNVYLRKFWSYLRNHEKHGRTCVDKLKMVGKFYRKCLRRRKVSVNTLFSLIMPETPANIHELNSLKFIFIESFWQKYGLETFFRFEERRQPTNTTSNFSNWIEILSPNPMTKHHLSMNTLKSLHLQPKDEMEVKIALFRIRSRMSKIISNEKPKETFLKYNASSLQYTYPQINWSVMIGERFNHENLLVVEHGTVVKRILLMINFTWSRDIKIFMIWKVISDILSAPVSDRLSRLRSLFRSDTKPETAVEDMCLHLTTRMYLQDEFSRFIEQYYIRPFARILRKLLKFYERSFLCDHKVMIDNYQNINNSTLSLDFGTNTPLRDVWQCNNSTLDMFSQTANLSFWKITLGKLDSFKQQNILTIEQKTPQFLSYDNNSNTVFVPFHALLHMYGKAEDRRCGSISLTVKNLWNKIMKLVKNPDSIIPITQGHGLR